MNERKPIDINRCPACGGPGPDATSPDPAARCRVCGGSGRLASPDHWDRLLDDLERRMRERAGKGDTP